MQNPVALYYDNGAYQETLTRRRAAAGSPAGLMGRQVAGKEFLDAYLSHGDWDELIAVTPTAGGGASLAETCRTHPSSRDRQRRLRLFTVAKFHDEFLPDPPARVLYFPAPPDPRFVWARRQGPPHGYAVSGVTHTLCSLRAVEVLRGLVTEPWEHYDRLICTSRAVTDMVRAVTDTFAEYLRDRHGGRPGLRIGLETVPLGVNVDRFRPATPDERTAERGRLGIAEDEIVVLFVGRLSHHAKAHPFPMFRGISQAAAATGAKVQLLLVGWAGNDVVLNAFRQAAEAFAGNVRVQFLDGLKDENRFGAWQAADVFTSLSDNVQETFGLVIVEAMASGLPVVATDWNGYRDLVVDGQTGSLVPTRMVAGATEDLTSRLLVGEINYDHFLARASQCVSVDVAAATAAFARLFRDAELRRQWGAAGRQRALEQFDWRHVVRRYEAIWQDQQHQLAAAAQGVFLKSSLGPEAYPALEQTFAGYPSGWLDGATLLQATPAAARLVDLAAKLPLTNHAVESRCGDPALLRRVAELARQPCPLATLAELLQQSGVAPQAARATLAWMLKYDALEMTNDK